MYLSVGNGTASNRSMLIGYARYGAVWVVCTVVNLVVIARSCTAMLYSGRRARSRNMHFAIRGCSVVSRC